MRTIKTLLLLVTLALVYSVLIPSRLSLEPIQRVRFVTTLVPDTENAVPGERAATNGEQPPVTHEARGNGSGREARIRPFRGENRFGYIRSDGTVKQDEAIAYGVTVADTHYVAYDRAPQELVVRAPGGGALATLPKSGYPVAAENRVYVLDPAQDGITAYELNSGTRELWSRRFSSPLTDLDAASGALLVGLLDGTAQYINADGEALQLGLEHEGGLESEVEVVYAVALSNGAGTLALLAGLRPQRLLVYELNEDGGFELLHQRTLEHARRGPSLLRFAPEGDRLVYEHGEVLTELSLRNFEHAELGLPAAVGSLALGAPDRPSAFVVHGDEMSEFLMLAPNRSTIMQSRLSEEDTFVVGGDECHLLGIGEVRVCLEITGG